MSVQRKGLFLNERFSGFGPSRFRPTEHQPPTGQVEAPQVEQLKQLVRQTAPRTPGVYGMLDRYAQLIYVGKAKYLRNRLLSYFRVHSRDPKAGRILEPTRTIVWEENFSEFSALVRELELIVRYLPRFNVQGIPGRQRYRYLCLGRGPGPYLYSTPRPTGREIACYGPVVGAARLREAARRLNDAFRLRDCSQKVPMIFADRRALFPQTELVPQCLRHEIGTCSGPCAGLVSQAAYAAQIRQVKAFLDGEDQTLLEQWEREMQAAAAAVEFEKAMAIRDKWQVLKWLSERMSWLRSARDQHSFVYPLVGITGETWWHLILRGRIEAVYRQPTTSSDWQHLEKAITKVYRVGGSLRETTVPAHQVDSVLLVAAWFRKHPEQRERLLTVAEAIQHCREQARAIP